MYKDVFFTSPRKISLLFKIFNSQKIFTQILLVVKGIHKQGVKNC